MFSEYEKNKKYSFRKFTTGFGIAAIGTAYFLSGTNDAEASEKENLTSAIEAPKAEVTEAPKAEVTEAPKAEV
ncbi:YSIRK-type signal peptide-containing protein, partial [Mammaliicoccus sciuri]|uniref:YSIRK-type signal peptide-containing protein n=1 Tax=Mammaliicoccus sciuri TaxID=1296 RepID=UPI001FB55C7E